MLNNRPLYVGKIRPLIINSGSEPTPPTPSVPIDMDFIYFANDFDGTKITNVAPNSTFGDYLQSGTLRKNGSGSTCYISKSSSNAYLYKDLTSTELDNIKAINNTYTFFIRMMQETSGTGGIMSCRSNGGYIYMIRCYNKQLQIHTSSGINLGSNFSLSTDRVYKVQISGSTFYAKNLDTNADYTLTYSTNRSMGTRMTTFNAGYSGEFSLDKFYSFAGIPRATTSEEDEIIKTALMNQSI
jgi:hypothetical protein